MFSKKFSRVQQEGTRWGRSTRETVVQRIGEKGAVREIAVVKGGWGLALQDTEGPEGHEA